MEDRNKCGRRNNTISSLKTKKERNPKRKEIRKEKEKEKNLSAAVVNCKATKIRVIILFICEL